MDLEVWARTEAERLVAEHDAQFYRDWAAFLEDSYVDPMEEY